MQINALFSTHKSLFASQITISIPAHASIIFEQVEDPEPVEGIELLEEVCLGHGERLAPKLGQLRSDALNPSVV